MYYLDPVRFRSGLKARGFASIGDLARSLGVHRNTIHYYLSGRGIFPAPFVKMLDALGLTPGEILVRREDPRSSDDDETLMSLIDELHARFPEVTFVLFGSRAEGRARRYSDWDIGVYSREGVSHARYRAIVRAAREAMDATPYLVDVVNLNRAEPEFLLEIAKHWRFLTGWRRDWEELRRKAA